MCDKAMKNMELVSRSRAVTSASGVWMTHGWHLKKATFSVQNYFTGALFDCTHCGRGKAIMEDLYQGTSKGAGGCAKLSWKPEEGINVKIHWQDADASSTEGVAELFPDARVMICGGHAGRAHMKQLQKLAKNKSPTKDIMIGKYSGQFPQINEGVCHCKERHSPGCGCLSEQFIQRARNLLSYQLMSQQNSLPQRLMLWPNTHMMCMNGIVGVVIFMCSCNHCEDKENFEGEGQDYYTRLKLIPLISKWNWMLRQAQMAEQVVHPILKQGHSLTWSFSQCAHPVQVKTWRGFTMSCPPI